MWEKKGAKNNDWVVATQIFLFFTPKIGEDVQFDEHIFQRGWFNHQLDVIQPKIAGIDLMYETW